MRGGYDGGNKMIELLASFLLCFIIKLRLYGESLSPDGMLGKSQHVAII